MLSQISKIKSQNYNSNPIKSDSNIKSPDLKVRAYKLSLCVIRFVNELPNQRGFWAIGDQLLRSITSIGANMIEAKSSSSKREFIKFYEIALKSANEAKYWLCLLRDSYQDLKTLCEELLSELNEVSNMLGSSILTLKGKKKF
ncbi:four helix bundle protein [Candidatus Microgenomates bacterium]|nr:MAG: four helix bundle protein [Candidatus Microgenomates bacterium]